MVLFFKPDSKNKLFFLFASSIRLKNKKSSITLLKQFKNKKFDPLMIDGNNFSNPENIKLI